MEEERLINSEQAVKCIRDCGIIIIASKPEIFTLKSLTGKRVSVFRGGSGLGFVRDYAVRSNPNSLIVMFDDDLVVHREFWLWLQRLNQGEFAIARVGKHFSTRIFAIHKKDYLEVGGFDTKIKFVFEDGDFVVRALKTGLRIKIVPTHMYGHIEHPRFRYRNLGLFNLEYCRIFVKYRQWVYRNLFEFFWRPFDWRIKLPDLATKIPFTVFWIIWSGIKNVEKSFKENWFET
ncbi:MAG: glycosyltransferase family 2 protein [Candidatus Bathyarchaeia archaeon]|jgi:GT2 family glycosyltransferase